MVLFAYLQKEHKMANALEGDVDKTGFSSMPAGLPDRVLGADYRGLEKV